MKFPIPLILILAFAGLSIQCSRKIDVFTISDRKILVQPEIRTIIQSHNKTLQFVSHRRLDTIEITPQTYLDTLILANCASIQNWDDDDYYLYSKGPELCSTEVVFLASSMKHAELIWDASRNEKTIFKNIDYAKFIEVNDTFKKELNIDPEFKNMNWRVYYPSKYNYSTYSYPNRGAEFNSDSMEYFLLGNDETLIGFKYLQDTTLYMRITK